MFLLDVLTNDPNWSDWSGRQIRRIVDEGDELAINPLIYAEISTGFETRQQVDEALASNDLRRLQLPWEAAFPAAQAFEQYRRRGGLRQSLLPDFYIGAHALVSGLRLLTRDINRYRTYFPDVELICPE